MGELRYVSCALLVVSYWLRQETSDRPPAREPSDSSPVRRSPVCPRLRVTVSSSAQSQHARSRVTLTRWNTTEHFGTLFHVSRVPPSEGKPSCSLPPRMPHMSQLAPKARRCVTFPQLALIYQLAPLYRLPVRARCAHVETTRKSHIRRYLRASTSQNVSKCHTFRPCGIYRILANSAATSEDRPSGWSFGRPPWGLRAGYTTIAPLPARLKCRDHLGEILGCPPSSQLVPIDREVLSSPTVSQVRFAHRLRKQAP